MKRPLDFNEKLANRFGIINNLYNEIQITKEKKSEALGDCRGKAIA